MVDYPVPADKMPPIWDSTTNGFSWVCPNPVLPWMAKGTLDSGASAPRTGIQFVINTVNNSATVQWDIALDQTRPVLYNVYVSPGTSIDFNDFKIVSSSINVNEPKAIVFAAIHEEMGQDYITRNPASGATSCPYQYTITGLQGEQTYSFAVRAEDSTQGLAPPTNSRIGPNGGLEELNTVTITVTVSGNKLSANATLASETTTPTSGPTNNDVQNSTKPNNSTYQSSGTLSITSILSILVVVFALVLSLF